MLTVRVIGKFHDSKGLLYGYRIKDMNTGEEMSVHKNELKAFVAQGRCIVDNMTLTSDGRLIGHATAKDRPVARVNIAGMHVQKPEVETVFTNGKKIACAMTKFKGSLPPRVEGINPGYMIELGIDVTSHIANGQYANIQLVDGKPNFDKVKKNSYSKIKDKLIKILEQNDVHTTLTVEKSSNKYEYKIVVDNRDILNNITLAKVVFVLIENCMYTNKIKPLRVEDNYMVVEAASGINDVRKSLKADNLHKIG